MKFVECEGIVIRKKDYGEADRYIDIFTKELGKISTIIGGIRKSKKRDQISSDIMTLSKFIVYKKNDNYIISSFSVIEPYIDLKSNIDNIDVALCIISILGKILLLEEKKEKLYKLVIKSLELLRKNTSQKKKYMLLAYFLFFLIKSEGFIFDLKNKSENIFLTNIKERIIYLLEIIYSNNKEQINYVASIDSDYTSSEIISLVFSLETYIEFHLGINFKLNDYLMGVEND